MEYAMGKLSLPFTLAAKLSGSDLRYKIHLCCPQSCIHGRPQLSVYSPFPFAKPFTCQAAVVSSETVSLTTDATVSLAAVTNSAPDRASILKEFTALGFKKEIIDRLGCLPSESFYEQWEKIQLLLEGGASPAQVRALLQRSRVSMLRFLGIRFEELVTVVKIFEGIDLSRHSVGAILTQPAVLRSPVQTLQSRVEYFQSIGMERGLVRFMLVRPAWILKVSLSSIEERLKAFKAIGLNPTQIQKAVCRCPRILSCNFDKCVIPKVAYMESIGCGTKAILTLLFRSPSIVGISMEVICKKVELLKKLGIANNPDVLIRALMHLCSYRCEKIQARCDWFRNRGFSFEEVGQLIGKFPAVFRKSEKDLERKFDYLEKILERDKKEVLVAPAYLCCAFENRIVHRFNVLRDKGLLKADVPLSTVINTSSDAFASMVNKQENRKSKRRKSRTVTCS